MCTVTLEVALMHKSRRVLEPALPVVIRMSHETTALSIQFFQT